MASPLLARGAWRNSQMSYALGVIGNGRIRLISVTQVRVEARNDQRETLLVGRQLGPRLPSTITVSVTVLGGSVEG